MQTLWEISGSGGSHFNDYGVLQAMPYIFYEGIKDSKEISSSILSVEGLF
jgi:hypothetical protein